MKFNLIDEKWIPIIRRDGTKEKIAPYEITADFSNNPIISLNAPRSDFNGALIQFLIGIVQTVAAPDDEDDWEEMLDTPPEPEILQQKFMTVHHAFDLGGDGPRFMQDFEILNVGKKPIDRLLIETPGDHTLQLNTDHFIKRSQPMSFCAACTATALFSMQINAPSGGQGYRTSLRGGGPLTTLIIGDDHQSTLWHTIWLNILEKQRFDTFSNSSLNHESKKFPWLAITNPQATEQDIHPAQYFWAMPRRIRLQWENSGQGTCDICSCATDYLIREYREVNRGTEYRAPMRHHLSPYNIRTQKAALTQPGGIVYRHWLGLITKDSRGEKEPAIIINKFLQERKRAGRQFRLWAFGYDMDNMKARCWYETKIPIVYADGDEELRSKYLEIVVCYVMAASEIGSYTKFAIKKAWFSSPTDVRGDTAFIDTSFWQVTEPYFYAAVGALKESIEAQIDSTELLEHWHWVLCRESLSIFDTFALDGPIEDANPKRTVLARSELQRFNNGEKVKKILGLPVANQPANIKSKAKTRKPRNGTRAKF